MSISSFINRSSIVVGGDEKRMVYDMVGWECGVLASPPPPILGLYKFWQLPVGWGTSVDFFFVLFGSFRVVYKDKGMFIYIFPPKNEQASK